MRGLSLFTAILLGALVSTRGGGAAETAVARKPIDVSNIVHALAAALREKYVFPETGARAAAFVEERLKSGVYSQQRNDTELAQALTDDLRKSSNDEHLVVEWHPNAVLTEPDETAEERRTNFGFERVERLPGNVGRLELHSFADPATGRRTAEAAMTFLANCDALIIDVRDNGGGSRKMVGLLASFLFRSRTHLIDYRWREGDRVEPEWTSEGLAVGKTAEIPVYIVTSRRTFSAAEELSYDLKTLGRATIVGETTRGGANPGAWIALSDSLRVFMPLGRAVSPISGTNWEGTGVIPDVSAPARQALDAAYATALDRLSSSATEPIQVAQLSWAKVSVAARLHPWALSAAEAERYAGTYGQRRVTRSGTSLSIRYQDLPPTTMIPLANETFALEGEDSFRVRFEGDTNGRAAALVGLTEGGVAYRSDRSPD